MTKLRRPRGPLAWVVSMLVAYLGAILIVMWVLDYEPAAFAVRDAVTVRLPSGGEQPVRGAILTGTAIEILDRVLHKRGGYLSNDVLPPGAWMDNVPNWEWGALVQIRDMAKALRNDFSRSQTQSTEDQDLTRADNHLNINNEAWMFPAAETEYGAARDAWESYLTRLSTDTEHDTQFYARADNLRNWLALIEKRLGDLSQRLGASVGQVRINTDLAGDAEAEQSTATPDVRIVQTPWMQIDDVFYEARGSTWALLHLLRAVEHDFGTVLDKKNAVVSLRQIIRELEATQDPVWSPAILNGEGLGFVANHSLVMASYISRANAAVIDLRMLLERG
ncbi:MAG: DUF2333 family protein [Gammaproteobacteria bacterium]|nr:DUF2333 family protein [Gammaproteobacteria bacterium]